MKTGASHSANRIWWVRGTRNRVKWNIEKVTQTCTIEYNGKKMQVRITLLHHPIHLMYHLRFEDGYENIFFTDAETGNWIEQDLGFTSLAATIGKTLESLYSGSALIRRDIKWIEIGIGNHFYSFGYFCYLISRYPVFEVYACNRKYMYSFILINTIEWKLLLLESPMDVNSEAYPDENIQEILAGIINDATGSSLTSFSAPPGS